VVSTKIPVTSGKPETVAITPTSVLPDAKSRLRSRNIAVGFGLVFLIVLFYLITIFKMGGHVVSRSI
jgi:hypothetical protein